MAVSRTSQCKRILDLLLAEAPNEVSLATLMNLRIASLTRRISDLRAQGYRIENRKQVVDGVTHSWYRLTAWNNPCTTGALTEITFSSGMTNNGPDGTPCTNAYVNGRT